MPLIETGGLSLWFDDLPSQTTNSNALPVLLIQGLGMQATEWPDPLLHGIAATRRAIVFDNRDAGLSSLCGPASDPALGPEDFPGWQPLPQPPAYDLAAMVADTLALLDARAIPRAHLIGYSMGGMIAQILAVQAPDRVASIVGLMTSAGQPWLAMQENAEAHMRRSIVHAPDPEQQIRQMLAAETAYAGNLPLPDIHLRRAAAIASLERANHPAGIWRQACAMRAGGDRQSILRSITAPYLGIHGARDPVISLSQAMAIPDLIPNARLHVLPEAGHLPTDELARAVLPMIDAFWAAAEAVVIGV